MKKLIFLFLLISCTKEAPPVPEKTTAEKIVGEWQADIPPFWVYTFCADGTGLWTASVGNNGVTQFQMFYRVTGEKVMMFKTSPEPAESVTWLIRWRYDSDTLAQVREEGKFKAFNIRKI